MSVVVKRSIAVRGHATSVSLEAPFWDGLRALATTRGVALAALVAEVDGARGSANLSSALRVAVLEHYRAGAAMGVTPS